MIIRILIIPRLTALIQAKVSWRIQHLDPCPHDKGLSVIAPVKDGVPDSNGGQRMSFVTGGADRTVVSSVCL